MPILSINLTASDTELLALKQSGNISDRCRRLLYIGLQVEKIPGWQEKLQAVDILERLDRIEVALRNGVIVEQVEEVEQVEVGFDL